MKTPEILKEQTTCLALKQQGKSREEIAKATGLSFVQVKRRLAGASKAARLDPKILHHLHKEGVTDLAGLHSGYVFLRNEEDNKKSSSLYFYLGPDEDRIDFAEAVKEVLSEVVVLPPIDQPRWEAEATDLANWFFLADLHVGGDYGDQHLSRDFEYTIDDLIRRMPKAERAVMFELGDLLDANDHKGVTPGSGNPCDTIRDNHFGNTLEALRLMKYAAYRLLQTHQEVEIYMVRGNHDETSFMSVLIGLMEHFRDNPRIKIFIPSTPEEEEFFVVQWGECACLPNHGDKCKPETLKEVFTDEFPDEYAQAKAYRLIATGHYHKAMTNTLGLVEHRQFGTIHKRNRWARQKFAPSRGQMSVITVHKTLGLQDETISPIKTQLRGRS